MKRTLIIALFVIAAAYMMAACSPPPPVDSDSCVYDASAMATVDPCTGMMPACKDGFSGDQSAACADGSLSSPAACAGGTYNVETECDAVGLTYNGSCLNADGSTDWYAWGDIAECDAGTNFTQAWGCGMLGGTFTCYAAGS